MGPVETKEEAQRRRLIQAQKRRLAVEKAAAQRAAAASQALAGGIPVAGKKRKSDSLESAPKKQRTSVGSASSTRRNSVGKKKDDESKSSARRPSDVMKEEDEENEENDEEEKSVEDSSDDEKFVKTRSSSSSKKQTPSTSSSKVNYFRRRATQQATTIPASYSPNHGRSISSQTQSPFRSPRPVTGNNDHTKDPPTATDTDNSYGHSSTVSIQMPTLPPRPVESFQADLPINDNSSSILFTRPNVPLDPPTVTGNNDNTKDPPTATDTDNRYGHSSTVSTQMPALPHSSTVSTQMTTLPHSSTVSTQIPTLPHSSTVSQIPTLPHSSTVSTQIPTLPHSSTVSTQIPTLPPLPVEFFKADLPINDNSSSILLYTRPNVPLDPPTHPPAAADSVSQSVNIQVPNMRELSELNNTPSHPALQERTDLPNDNKKEDVSDQQDEDDIDEALQHQALKTIADIQSRTALLMQQQNQEPPKKTSTRSFLVRFLLLCIVLLLFWFVFEIPNMDLPPVHYCFLDSDQNTVTQALDMDPFCSDNAGNFSFMVEWAPCPAGAQCRGGRLVECPALHDVIDQGCYLSSQSNQTIAAVRELLHNWTVGSYCPYAAGGSVKDSVERANTGDLAKCPAAPWLGRPCFPKDMVVLNLGLNDSEDFRSLLQLGNVSLDGKAQFVDLDVWISLHPDVPIKIPTSCQAARVFFASLVLVAAAVTTLSLVLLDVARHFGWVYCRTLMASPLYVCVASLFFVGVSLSLQRRFVERQQRRERDKAIVQARHAVHERLQALTNNEYPELSSMRLCQDLAWKLNEMSSRGRKRFATQIWPSVVRDIGEDDRISKKIRTEGGQRVEYWKWEAPPPPRSVRFQ